MSHSPPSGVIKLPSSCKTLMGHIECSVSTTLQMFLITYSISKAC